MALLLVAVWLLPGAARAENGFQLGANVTVGFGVVDSDKADTTQFDGVGEATLAAEAAKGPFSARLEITVADSTEELDTAEHEVVWHPAEGLAIIISGRSFGVGPEDARTEVVNAPAGQVGDEEARIDFADTGLLNVEYEVGGLVLGLAVLDACVPECGYAFDAEGERATAGTEQSTLVAHLRGEGVPLQYNVYVAQSSGTFEGTEESGSATGVGLGLAFDSESFGVGFDASQATVECSPEGGATACADDNTRQAWGVAVTVGGFAAHYVSITDETGSFSEDTANVDVVYLFTMDDAVVGPEYRTTTVTAPDGTETTASFLLFGMSLEF